ncbi:Hpt domain-containing protein [Roseateles toxinivorans]|uniref:Chemotaxis protein CheA n=1 Tax=Roseateles toxinivorans TaxID=270368 RepID=A0A4V3CTC2_9BURK|nr:Hpt domain-containing protein [Roseateles toxinivorans]TDP71317.1 chemosensory pili system protein ChpA (sensor histidine kinase/response regulator) [Roseateles toxinivorans]
MDLPRDSEFPADLSPLAWVQEELRRSLEAAHKALRRYARDVDAPRISSGVAGQDTLDLSALNSARQQVHQAAGVVSLVGLPAGATMLRACEAGLQSLIDHPERIKLDAIETLERADFALLDYVARLLAGRPVSSLSLFPPYRAVQALAGAERIHPADLWTHEWSWQEPPREITVTPRKPESARSAFETTLLKFMREGSADGARALSELCASMAAGAPTAAARSLWHVAAAFFEAQGIGMLQPDAFAKRIGSRLLAQLRAGAAGDPAVADRLARDLLFFCAQSAAPPFPAAAPRLHAVRQAYGLDEHQAVDYEEARLGLVDPAWVVQARKRVSVAKDAWSSVAEGDVQRLQGLDELFALVSESLQRLFPRGEVLGQTLQRAVVGTARASAAPSSALAMEVATAMLYVDAALEDAAFDAPEQADRVQRLAQRVESVAHGDPAQPLEAWMEELYRRVSDRQTMGSVVQELRSSLSETEKLVDEYFRDTSRRQVLIPVPGQLSAMRGVLTVLGMEQAAQAVLRMRDEVDELVNTEVDATRQGPRQIFERLAGNLGALGFLIDMLSVQPHLAKRLFKYDDETGVLAPVMGRREGETSGFVGLDELLPLAEPVEVPTQPEPLAEAPAEQPEVPDFGLDFGLDEAQPPVAEEPEFAALPDIDAPPPLPDPVRSPLPAAAALPVLTAQATDTEIDAEMLEVFLEECDEVVANAREALAQLQLDSSDQNQLTTVRRAFHTLKGSSRMVGLLDFGEGAWACEQLYNARLGDNRPADAGLLGFSAEALDYLYDWRNAIAEKRQGGHQSASLRRAADALRIEGRVEALEWPQAAVAEPAADGVAEVAGEVPEFPVPEPEAVLEPTELAALEPELMLDLPVEAIAAPETQEDDFFELDLPDLAVTALPETIPEAVAEPALPTFELDLDFGEVKPLVVAEDEAPPALPDDELPALPVPADVPLSLDQPDDEDLLLPEDEPPVVGPEPEVIEVAEPAAPVEPEPEPEPESEPEPEPVAEPAAEEVPPKPHLELVHSVDALVADEERVQALAEQAEAVKVIGPLRISIALFNIFLNEADELSRRLCVELAEWALELNQPLPESSVSLAHSLAGNAATVGFEDLSRLARLLEHALERSHPLGRGTVEEGELFVEAADEIRRLLHQFAAGFLKTPDAALNQRLIDHEHRAAERLQDLALHAPLVEPDSDDMPLADVIEDPAHTAPDDEALAVLAAETLAGVEESPEVMELVEPEPEPAQSLLGQLGEVLSGPLQPVAEVHAVPGRAHAQDELDVADLDAEDAIDEELFPIFEEEGIELLQQLAALMRDWQSKPADMSSASACMRNLHTLKGGARLAGAMRLGEMAHRMESVVESLLGSGQADAHDIERLQSHVDAMAAVFDALRHPPVPAEVEPVMLAAAVPAPEPEPALPVVAEVVELEALEALEALDAPEPEAAQPAAPAAPLPAPVEIDWSRFAPSGTAAAPQERAQSAAAQGMVRVRAPLLERLINQAGEVSIRRSRMESEVAQMKGSLNDLTDNLERLRQQLRDMEFQADAQISSSLESAKQAERDFDPLEFDRYTRVQELTRIMAESVGDVATVQRTLQRALQAAEDELAAQARLTRDLQDDLLSTRMVEFDSLSDRLYRVLRQAAKETGKQVRLDVQGGSIEVDRGVLERMTAAFEHLLRNSVIHGIEAPEKRVAAGKEATGNIVVALTHEGNEVAVEFRDDGAGLDLERIRQRAVQMGLLTADARPGTAELTQLIFMHGFSTASALTEMAGRGVGMDVVRDDVNAMGGRIASASSPGQGTSFKLLLPLTTAVTQVVMLRCGDDVVAVPATLIEVVKRVPVPEIESAYRSGTFTVGEPMPFFWLGGLLQQSAAGVLQGRNQPLVIVKSAQQRVALHVDEVIGNQEVVVKNLGPQLARVPGLAGITLLASGAAALIYNPVALATLHGDRARQRAEAALHAQTPQAQEIVATLAPTVMVVDDSLTVRRVTQRLLEREGYRVILAKDGLDALEKLADELPDMVLSDIEMPRMDGFDLVRNMHADARLRGLPVIMITSRIAQKHKDYAAELGVQHYLGKPYDEEELLALIARYTSRRING